MNCEVYHSKLYALATLPFLLLFAAGCTWGFTHDHEAPLWFKGIFAFIISVCLVGVLRSLVWTAPVIRVDDEGIHDRRGRRPVIAWADVLAVERPPKVQRSGGENTSYLRDAWRPLRLTVRNPERYRARFRNTLFPSFAPEAHRDRTTVQIEFTGLTPGSDVVEKCIRDRLRL